MRIGIRMIKKSKSMQALPTDNLGGRKNCITDKVGPLIIFLYDTQFQQRVDFVLNFLQCSYLLRPNAVHINLHVMHQTIMVVLLTTIKQFHFYLRTRYGDSDSYYIGDRGSLLQVGRHGNGSEPEF